MEEMTKRERVMAAVKGEPVDRIPVSFFVHNHQAERSPDSLVPHLLNQNQEFDWDFIKGHLRASYYAEAWGCKYRWNPEKGPELESFVIKSAEDLKRLKKVDPTRGVLGEHVKVSKLLGEALKGAVPYVLTIFSPLMVAGKLVGGQYLAPSETEIVKRFMKEDPEALRQGLSAISQTLADYAREVIRAGADGIFFSTGAWSRDAVTEEEYEVFGRPYDLAILEATVQEGATFNISHLCRENIMLDFLDDYPVQVINYDALTPPNPTLKQAMKKTDKALWGGLTHKQSSPDTLLQGPVDTIIAQVHSALDETGGRRFFLGPGCSISTKVPKAHLVAARDAIFTWSRK